MAATVYIVISEQRGALSHALYGYHWSVRMGGNEYKSGADESPEIAEASAMEFIVGTWTPRPVKVMARYAA